LVPAASALAMPPRITPDQARVGETYELVLTSGAGLWACRTGLHLVIDEQGRLRTVPAPTRGQVVRRDPPSTLAPAGHRPSAGTPAGRPGMPFRSPWSAPADRGG